MKSFIFAAACAVVLGGCATSTTLMASNYVQPEESVSVLVMEPDVKMMFMTTSGSELRVDWSETATENLMNALKENLQGSADNMLVFSSENEMSEGGEQIMLLNEAVTQSMENHVGLAGSNVIPVALPHKEENPFDFYLGSSVSDMAEGYDAKYALFMTANSQFESSGVIFRNILIAAATATVTGGAYAVMPASQSYKGVFITLVDLENGQVVWANGLPSGNPRNEEAAGRIIDTIMATSPLAQ